MIDYGSIGVAPKGCHPMPSLSVKQFRERLTSELREVASEQGWDQSKSSERGYTFQLWYGFLIDDVETSFDTDAADAMLYSKDLGVDLVFEDATARRLLICQCKYQKPQSAVAEDEVDSFFDRHDHLLDRDWVQKHGSLAAQELLLDYSERVQQGWTIELRFVTTGKASDRVQELAARKIRKLKKADGDVVGSLVDFSSLKEFYIQAETLEESIPDVVEFHLRKGSFFKLDHPYPTVVGAVSGNELRNLVQAHKQALFAFNIRGYLGSKGMNNSIVASANGEPEHFFYFNNGVTAICTDFKIVDNKVRAESFQIINGAQTVNALHDARSNPQVSVLFRLIKAEAVRTEKGINAKIIKFNNSQNVVKISDFRSNDHIQLWLEEHLISKKAGTATGKVHYVRKRQTRKRGVGFGVKLEEFSKLRYAFLYEPTLTQEAPKDLWTPQAEGGSYEKAFGINGVLADMWSQDDLDQSFLAIAIYTNVLNDLAERVRGNPDLRFMKRLRFHSMALMGEFVRANVDRSEYRRLWSQQSAFDDQLGEALNTQRRVVGSVHDQHVPQTQTMFAFVRSTDRWGEMLRQFNTQIALL